jgi:hypothetical protein
MIVTDVLGAIIGSGMIVGLILPFLLMIYMFFNIK